MGGTETMKPYWSNGRVVLWQGHVLDCLAAMEAGSVHCAISSPPYYSLRDYDLPPVEWPAVSYAPMAGLPPLDIPGCAEGCEHVWVTEITKRGSGGEREYGSYDGAVGRGPAVKLPAAQYCQLCGGWKGSLGLEPTVEAFVGHIVLVARELWRVLRDDGTFWLNFGDSYNNRSISRPSSHQGGLGFESEHLSTTWADLTKQGNTRGSLKGGLKEKDLIGIPWRVAFALQADGWFLRSDIIWAKGVSFCPTYSGSCMPGSQRDRPTTSHEHVFLLSKKARYFYDNEAVKEPSVRAGDYPGGGHKYKPDDVNDQHIRAGLADLGTRPVAPTRNLRSVWTISTGNFKGSHFAVFPPALVEPMIKAGTSQRGCCPKCLSPWVRVTERIQGKPQHTPGGESEKMHAAQGTHGKTSLINTGGGAQNITTGWTPTCSCSTYPQHASYGGPDDVGELEGVPFEPVPCTVLDPFLGSGTTAEVAIRLGRAAVGIELSKDYCDDHIIPRLSKGIQMEMTL